MYYLIKKLFSFDFFYSLKVRKKFKKLNINHKKKINIIMNGPGIKFSYDEIITLKKDSIMVCNHFADTKLYEKLKPENYIFLDKYFFDDSKKYRHEYVKKTQKTFKNFLSKTSWSINLFVPYLGVKKIKKLMDSNKYIKVVSYNTNYLYSSKFNINKPLPEKILFFLWKHNLFAPPLTNVCQSALYICSLLGFKEIRIYGLDLNNLIMIKNINNDLYRSNSYFYSKVSNDLIYENKYSFKKQSLYKELYRVAYNFEMFDLLYQFLKSNKIKVINNNLKSLIDSFPKS